MAIDILNIQPSVISRDLKGKYVLVYGQPKTGKTTLACQFPKSLLLAFEKGYNAIANVRAVDITKWSDLKLVLRQLEKPEAKAAYDTIIIDTATIAWDLCESFICSQAGVQKISDIPWGGGYKLLSQEFEQTLRKITMLGYGMVLITHVEVRRETINDSEIEFLSPSLNKRCYPICNRLVDIIGYIGIEWNKDGEAERWLYTRETPRIMAGSRFKYLAPKVKFGYNELVNAIADALDKEQSLDGATVVDKPIEIKETEQLDYEAIREEARSLWTKLVGGEDEEPDIEMAKRIGKRVEMIFGQPMKLSDITEDQVDLFYLVLLDMRDLVARK